MVLLRFHILHTVWARLSQATIQAADVLELSTRRRLHPLPRVSPVACVGIHAAMSRSTHIQDMGYGLQGQHGLTQATPWILPVCLPFVLAPLTHAIASMDGTEITCSPCTATFTGHTLTIPGWFFFYRFAPLWFLGLGMHSFCFVPYPVLDNKPIHLLISRYDIGGKIFFISK
ncbi:uncharacterized protein F4812DRAFT_31976 [Daldinia caldariorum]|uniref:uncharacterized protein n=1 Tax=Daldinia caldariorum TaxID=326644 RepID=UPI002008B297|nr:uncharacterized protein F4812DRAFT_31976 [Daldinia caldariorum]KAI1472925.1 hypothetical protein F4812DRAFT_31976 [Daldinia caldariorum]